MEDGRKKIDGKIEQSSSPNALWTTTINRGVANEWRNQAEGTTRLQRAKKYGKFIYNNESKVASVENLTYDCQVFLHRAVRSYGTPVLVVFNAILIIIVLYVFKIIAW